MKKFEHVRRTEAGPRARVNKFEHIPVFSLTVVRSPMARGSYWWASDFLNYSPRLASDILAEQKSEKKEKTFFLKKIVSPSSHDTEACQKLIQ